MVICFVGEMMENDFSKSWHRLRPSTAQTQHKAGSIVENACGKDQKNILLITLNFFQVTTLHGSVQHKAGLLKEDLLLALPGTRPWEESYKMAEMIILTEMKLLDDVVKTGCMTAFNTDECW